MNDAITAHDLEVRYGKRCIFADLSFALQAGTFTALVGPNGAGKSSLLRVLAGVQKPAAGEIVAEGRAALIDSAVPPPGDVTPHELAGYGMAIRRPFWRFQPDANELLVTERALADCALSARAHDAVKTLSAGEAQRAWIAAGLATQPAVLLIDEPTAHLDLKFQLEVADTLARLARTGVAVMAAFHDLTLAGRACDAVALLAHGEIRLGEPDSILQPKLLSDAFGVRVSTYRSADGGPLVCAVVS
ncbi:MAG: ABC transporter ATP-binding protein [Candidatus Eremiobacteraeota bacterium]|nr:ABC transporter ATP-binding protein [Candidatus Eremiobacteraeota bacterium]MBC5827664.1 ABC transporter ATP-binding protein [Candidatus Eremiobacteraeota bacterium]